MQSSLPEKLQVREQRGRGEQETQRSSQAEGEQKHMQVERERRSVRWEGEAGARRSPKEVPAAGPRRAAPAVGKAGRGERNAGRPENIGMSPNGEAKPSGKPVRYLEVRLKIWDYRHSCKQQLYHLISCFVRLLSGNLSSEGKREARDGPGGATASVGASWALWQQRWGKGVPKPRIDSLGSLWSGWTPS